MLIERFYSKFIEKFEDQNISSVEVSGKWYDELYDVSYSLSRDLQNELLDANYTPHLKEDKIERDKILKHFTNKKEHFNDEPFTRQLVFTPNYDNNPNLNSCLSLFNLIFRNNKVNLHVHVRSQHVMNNFLYDNQTFSILLDKFCKLIKKEKGIIKVNIISLHREIKNEY